MDATERCAGCAGPLPAGRPGRLCSRCLVQAMEREDDLGADEAARAARAAPALSRFGDYELLGEIARGGMGVVYRARQVGLNREVALKVIATGLLAGETERRRFRTEAEAVAQLDHPNIVPIHDVGEHDGRPYFTMKLIEGGSLASRISNLKSRISNPPAAAGATPSPGGEGRGEGECSSDFKFDIRHSALVLSKVARAVHYAHQRGILHRDLKPANILLDETGEPFVTDFGLAKRLTSNSTFDIRHSSFPLTLSGAALGTPNYMAPEQARGDSKQATTAADIYSLGAILYELLCGRPPFAAATALETMRQVVDQDPVPPSRRRREVISNQCSVTSEPSDARHRKTDYWSLNTDYSSPVDRDLETICLKCLEKDPARRYPTAEALAEDLERWLRHEPIHARPGSVWNKSIKWIRRQPYRAALVFLLVVLAGGALALFGPKLWRHQRRQIAEARAQVQRAAHWRQCQTNLLQWRAAWFAFAQASNRPPDSLDELAPAFVRDTNALRCPLVPLGVPPAQYLPAAGRAAKSSYLYDFITNRAPASVANDDPIQLWANRITFRQLRLAQTNRYGPGVPLIRCGHHFPLLNVSFDGQVFESHPVWVPQVVARAETNGTLPPGWFARGVPASHHRTLLDWTAAHGGQASVLLESEPVIIGHKSIVLGNYNSLIQSLRADRFRGRRVRASAWLRADSLDEYAAFSVALADRNNRDLPGLDLPPASLLRGTARWQRCEVQGEVPADCETLSLVAEIRGSGRLWVDDVALEIDGQPLKSAPPQWTNFYGTMPVNLDFEARPESLAGRAARKAPPAAALPAGNIHPVTTPLRWCAGLWHTNCQVTTDRTTGHASPACARLHSALTGTNESGYLQQTLAYEPLRSGRVRVAAWLKSERLEGAGCVWLHVWYVVKGDLLPRETRSLQTVQGTTDWTLCELTVDVPETAMRVEFGCRLDGGGTLWADDFTVEWFQGGVRQPLPAGYGGNWDFEE